MLNTLKSTLLQVLAGVVNRAGPTVEPTVWCKFINFVCPNKYFTKDFNKFE